MEHARHPLAHLFAWQNLPLVCAVSYQSFVVYQWLWQGSHDTGWPTWIACILGGLGFEFLYVASIAFAESRGANGWTWITAFVCMAFSTSVAVYVYRDQGWAALLHAGFPIGAACFAMQLYASRAQGVTAAAATLPPAPHIMVAPVTAPAEHLLAGVPAEVPAEVPAVTAPGDHLRAVVAAKVPAVAGAVAPVTDLADHLLAHVAGAVAASATAVEHLVTGVAATVPPALSALPLEVQQAVTAWQQVRTVSGAARIAGCHRVTLERRLTAAVLAGVPVDGWEMAS